MERTYELQHDLRYVECFWEDEDDAYDAEAGTHGYWQAVAIVENDEMALAVLREGQYRWKRVGDAPMFRIRKRLEDVAYLREYSGGHEYMVMQFAIGIAVTMLKQSGVAK